MDFFALLLELAQGVTYTVLVTLSCATAGLVTGLLAAGLRRLKLPWLGWLLDAYTFVFRGVPVLVLLFLVYFGLPSLGLKVAPLLAMVSHLPRGDWRIGAPFFFCAALQAVSLYLAVLHLRRHRHQVSHHFSNPT